MNFEAKKKPLNWRKIIPVVIVLLIAGYSMGQPYLVKWTGINFPSINGEGENIADNDRNGDDKYKPTFVPQKGNDSAKTGGGNGAISSGSFQLTDLGGDKFRSPAGLIYRRAGHGEHRIDHVMRHAKDDPGRPVHGFFTNSSRDDVLGLIDEGYELVKQNSNRVTTKRDPKKPYRTTYLIDMQRKIGVKGGKNGRRQGNQKLSKLQLVIDNGDQVITAYPK